MLRGLVKKILASRGYELSPLTSDEDQKWAATLTTEEQATIERARPFTMTSVQRMTSLVDATRYIVENDIPGDIVECGVWRGGSMMIVAEMLKVLGDIDRRLWLYDTFEGMTKPAEIDRR